MKSNAIQQCMKGDVSSHGFAGQSHIVLRHASLTINEELASRLHYYKKLCGPYWCVIS